MKTASQFSLAPYGSAGCKEPGNMCQKPSKVKGLQLYQGGVGKISFYSKCKLLVTCILRVKKKTRKAKGAMWDQNGKRCK